MSGNGKRVAWFSIGLALFGLCGYFAFVVFQIGTIPINPDLQGEAYWDEVLRLAKLQPLGVAFAGLFALASVGGAVLMVRAVTRRPGR